jgi:lysophospholipase L1-like esterase
MAVATIDSFVRGTGESNPYSLPNHTADNTSTWTKNNANTSDLQLTSDGQLQKVNQVDTAINTFYNSTTFASATYELSLPIRLYGACFVFLIGGYASGAGTGVVAGISRTSTTANILYLMSAAYSVLSNVTITDTLAEGLSVTYYLYFFGSNVAVAVSNNSTGLWLTSAGSFTSATKTYAIVFNGFTNSSANTCGIGHYQSATSTNTTKIDALFADYSPPAYSVLISVSNANLFRAPYNTYIDSTGNLVLANSSASLKFTFTGESCILNLGNNNGNCTLRVYVDSAKPLDFDITAKTSALIVISGLTYGSHTIKIFHLRRFDYTAASWNGEQSCVINSIMINATTAQSAIGTYTPRTKRGLEYGDSISEGLFLLSATNNAGAASTASWASLTLDWLDTEFSVFGWGGQGWNNGGTGGIPTFLNAFNYMQNGVPITVTQQPDYIIINMGTNDYYGSLTLTQAQFNNFMTALRTLYGTKAKVFFLVPFGGFYRSTITTVVNSYLLSSLDQNTYLIDLGADAQVGVDGFTTGANQYSTDGVHPTAENAGRLAGFVIKAINKILEALKEAPFFGKLR